MPLARVAYKILVHNNSIKVFSKSTFRVPRPKNEKFVGSHPAIQTFGYFRKDIGKGALLQELCVLNKEDYHAQKHAKDVILALATSLLQPLESLCFQRCSQRVKMQSIRLCSCKEQCSEEGKRTFRGRLPWEIDYFQRCRETKPSEFPCKDRKPEEVVNKLTLSECELRQLKRCMRVHKNKEYCKMFGISSVASRKTYPMSLVDVKGYLPGCPKGC